MKNDRISRRVRERLQLSLPVRVYCRESMDYEWTEMTRLVDVTPFGARFTITRPTEPGRLLHLTLAMPRPLRCFDHVEDQYRLWTLVRNVSALKVKDANLPRFEVGVAFVGKRAPASFEADPTKRYDVASSVLESGLWRIEERPAYKPRPGDDERRDTRHRMAVDMVVEVFDEKGQVTASEVTVTEDISKRGASVFTTLNVAQGRFLRLTSAQYGISIIAAVRVRRLGADGIARLQLEFIGQEWPLEGVEE